MAAALGQEPYSLAMILLEEKRQMPGWEYDIIATDISHQALAKAEAGRSTEFEVQRGLPPEYLKRYFEPDDSQWVIRPDVKSLISFQHFNLLNSPVSLGTFDVIFCRNVLIYFEEATKRQVLERIRAILTPDGLLFLGGAETVVGITEAFAPIQGQRGVYKIN